MDPAMAKLAEHYGVSAEELEGLDPSHVGVRIMSHAFFPGERRHRLADVAEAAGVTPSMMRRVWVALGFPDPLDARIFTDTDVRWLRWIAKEAARSEQALDRFRGMSAGAARAAASAHDALRSMATQLDQTEPGGPTAGRLLDRFSVERGEQLLAYLFRRQFVQAVERGIDWSPHQPLGDVHTLAVGFSDVAGFTAFTRDLGRDELRELVQRFDRVANEVVTEHGGRLVKTIGDEVMWVNPEAVVAVHTALEMVERFEHDPKSPPMRAAIDLGPVMLREGDVFGPTVNRAARLVATAAPGEVLVAESVREHLAGSALRFEPKGEVDLRDIGRVQVFTVSRA